MGLSKSSKITFTEVNGTLCSCAALRTYPASMSTASTFNDLELLFKIFSDVKSFTSEIIFSFDFFLK